MDEERVLYMALGVFVERAHVNDDRIAGCLHLFGFVDADAVVGFAGVSPLLFRCQVSGNRVR